MLIIVTGGVEECIGCVVGREVKKWLGHILQKQTGASWAIFIDHISSEGNCAVLMQCTSACDTCTLQSTAIIYHCKHEFILSPVSDPYAKKLWLLVIFSLCVNRQQKSGIGNASEPKHMAWKRKYK